ncbi:MAG: hypothetical protein JO019_03200, partial [Candidatus Kaiserbacteria bacterium]|nr:hypothetical protein [Candidatus Kaiserbacteria bacterium]
MPIPGDAALRAAINELIHEEDSWQRAGSLLVGFIGEFVGRKPKIFGFDDIYMISIVPEEGYMEVWVEPDEDEEEMVTRRIYYDESGKSLKIIRLTRFEYDLEWDVEEPDDEADDNEDMEDDGNLSYTPS